MNIEKKLIPLLRFPEYTYANSFWLENNVGDSIKTLSPPKKLQSNDYKRSGKYPIIDQSQGFICGYSDDNSAVINKNSKELIVFGDHTCVLKFIDFPFIQGADGIKIFEPKDAAEVDVRYLYQYLVSSQIESKEYKRHFSELKEKIFLYPKTIKEQTKIADCLFAIDTYISFTNEKVEQLKAHNRSLLQKLFPQGGKTIPEYRFPEFEKDGSWEEKELGELILEIAEFTSRRNNVPLYSLTIEDGVSPKTDRYERNFLVKKEGDNFKVVHPDDFVSNPMNLRFGAIGYNKESFKVCVSGYYDVFRFKDKGTSSFWINYMKSNWALDMYDRIAIGSLYEKRRVHFSNLLRMKLLVPKYSERLKISEYLSSMEEVIGFYSEKASLLEQHKKGLMQQLFPKA